MSQPGGWISPSAVRLATSSPSILKKSVGNCCSFGNGVWPVPKSSMPMCTPSSLQRRELVRRGARLARRNTLSVSSSHSRSGSTPVSSSIAAIVSARPGSASSRPERFTDIQPGQPASRQCRACVHAARIAHAPIGTIVPVCSAISRN